MAWHDVAAPVGFDVLCGGEIHHIRWDRGALHLDDHGDPDAERVLRALGGEAPRCVEVLELWDRAIDDGGFIEEWWRYLEVDSRRRWWLRTALERLVSEGVQDFLYDLPRARAAQMGETAVTFPHEILDRAAATVVDRADGDDWRMSPPLTVHVVDAVKLRARRAFVTSLEALRHTRSNVGSAPLIPFRCDVRPGTDTAVTGHLDGRRSRVELSLHPAWLSRVWGRGVAVHGGRLTIDAQETAEGVVLHQVDWRPRPAGSDTSLAPVVVTTAITTRSDPA